MANKSLLEDVKSIDNETKMIVHGYIRQVELLLPDDNIYYTIPTLVIHWILLYFYVREQFDAEYCHSEVVLTNDNTFATLKNPYPFFKMMMLSVVVKSGVHRWRFQRGEPDCYIGQFGIFKNQYLSQVELNTELRDVKYLGKCYGMTNDGHVSKAHQDDTKRKIKVKSVRKDGILEMTLDLNKKELRYQFNGNDLGAVFTNIEETEYRACISGCGDKQEYKILSYEHLIE